MVRIDEIKNLSDWLYNANLTPEDEIPGISSEEKVNLVNWINNARAEAERLRILDIMKKICNM